jgi:hypothetical protein
MARGTSFFRNPVKWITKKLVPPAPPPRQPPRRPPRGPEPPEPPGRGPDSFYRDLWDADVPRRKTRAIQRETGYSRREQLQLHVELFLSTNMTELERDEQEEAWSDYLASFVTNRRPHREWFETWGLDPRDFDWSAWRHAMGYRNRR